MCSWSWLHFLERSGWNSKLWVWREFLSASLSILYWNHMSTLPKTWHGPLNWHLMWSSVSVILHAQRKEAAGNACPKATVNLFPFWELGKWEKLWKSCHCSFFHLEEISSYVSSKLSESPWKSGWQDWHAVIKPRWSWTTHAGPMAGSQNCPPQGCLALVSTEHFNFSYFPQDWDSKNTSNTINCILTLSCLRNRIQHACCFLKALLLQGTKVNVTSIECAKICRFSPARFWTGLARLVIEAQVHFKPILLHFHNNIASFRNLESALIFKLCFDFCPRLLN